MSRQRAYKILEVLPGRIIRTVELYFKSATATAVFLTGDYTSGCFPRLPLRRERAGLWRIQLLLAPGRYRYQFIVDRRWLNDSQACSADPRRLGGANCALRVE